MRTIAETPAYARRTPRASVLCVIAHDRAAEGLEALASVAASDYEDLDVLILLDASSDRTVKAAKRFLKDHPELPATLLRQPADRGLADARNLLAERARGEYLLILDASGGIYPSTLGRLARALDADARATFSYPMVAAYEGDRPVELLSSLPWEPERLRSGNWIDGTVLIRRERLLELGGYSTDPRLAGWEDFHLWCRCAAAGAHGVHVPQVLAWRRRAADTATPALLYELFPELLAGPNVEAGAR